MNSCFYLSHINDEDFYEGLKWIELHPNAGLRDLPEYLRNLWINPYFYLIDHGPSKEDPRLAIFQYGYKINNTNGGQNAGMALTRRELWQYYACWQMKLCLSVLLESGVFEHPKYEEVKLFQFSDNELKELSLLKEFWKEVSPS